MSPVTDFRWAVVNGHGAPLTRTVLNSSEHLGATTAPLWVTDLSFPVPDAQEGWPMWPVYRSATPTIHSELEAPPGTYPLAATDAPYSRSVGWALEGLVVGAMRIKALADMLGMTGRMGAYVSGRRMDPVSSPVMKRVPPPAPPPIWPLQKPGTTPGRDEPYWVPLENWDAREMWRSVLERWCRAYWEQGLPIMIDNLPHPRFSETRWHALDTAAIIQTIGQGAFIWHNQPLAWQVDPAIVQQTYLAVSPHGYGIVCEVPDGVESKTHPPVRPADYLARIQRMIESGAPAILLPVPFDQPASKFRARLMYALACACVAEQQLIQDGGQPGAALVGVPDWAEPPWWLVFQPIRDLLSQYRNANAFRIIARDADVSDNTLSVTLAVQLWKQEFIYEQRRQISMAGPVPGWTTLANQLDAGVPVARIRFTVDADLEYTVVTEAHNT